MAKQPKEDPIEQQERLRQRRQALLDRNRAARENAASLGSDIRATYGLGGLSAFGTRGFRAKRRGTTAPTAPTATNRTPDGR